MIFPTSARDGSPHGEPVDTRDPGGVEGRLYLSPFAVVWDGLLEHIRSRSRWELVHRDEELGLITVRCRGVLGSGAALLTAWVSLDANGLTRLDLRSVPTGSRDFGTGERRVRTLLRTLDRQLGPAARVTD